MNFYDIFNILQYFLFLGGCRRPRPDDDPLPLPAFDALLLHHLLPLPRHPVRIRDAPLHLHPARPHKLSRSGLEFVQQENDHFDKKKLVLFCSTERRQRRLDLIQIIPDQFSLEPENIKICFSVKVKTNDLSSTINIVESTINTFLQSQSQDK